MSVATIETREPNEFIHYTRSGGGETEPPFEKPVVVPAIANRNPAAHAWADARFAVDIMAEHALFFALMMPPEVAEPERAGALKFNETLTICISLSALPCPIGLN
jgi:hypothetical protein